MGRIGSFAIYAAALFAGVAAMADSAALIRAKQAKKDEFYTQYEDIQKEVNAYIEYDPSTFRGKTVLCPCDDPEWSNFTKFFAENFGRLGLKKLVSTSYAPAAKKEKYGLLYEMEVSAGARKEVIDVSRGRILVIDRDVNGDGRIDFKDLEWSYLEGDGDFRSDEVKKLRDEADIIVTNPPFSMFREFLAWIMEGEKKFLIIGNLNAVTTKEVFPLVKDRKVWFGESIHSGDREFGVPKEYPLEAAGWRVDDNGNHYIRVKGVRWYTNLEHGRRHQPMKLMTMADNVKYSKHKKVKGIGYKEFDNYDAINVPHADAIPIDYDGVMGVPITFLDKYCPEQFEIVSANDIRKNNSVPVKPHGLIKDKDGTIDGDAKYPRICIRKRKGAAEKGVSK